MTISYKKKVKICGVSDTSTLKLCLEQGVDFIGFVFFEKSPRNISFEKASVLNSTFKEFDNKITKKVAVTVDATDEEIDEIMKSLQPHFIQLHGKESQQRVSEIKLKYPDIKIIKAISIANIDDINKAKNYIAHSKVLGVFQRSFHALYKLFKPSLCLNATANGYIAQADYIMFDAKTDESSPLPGGMGKSFDWSLLEAIDDVLGSTPYFLAGGININNVKDAISNTNAYAIDVSSGVESSQGVKDPQKIIELIKLVKNSV